MASIICHKCHRQKVRGHALKYSLKQQQQRTGYHLHSVNLFNIALHSEGTRPAAVGTTHCGHSGRAVVAVEVVVVVDNDRGPDPDRGTLAVASWRHLHHS